MHCLEVIKRMNEKKEDENKEFWWPLITDKNGNLDENKILNELADYSDLIARMNKLLDHCTGGKLSKANYHLKVMVDEIDAHYERLYQADIDWYVNKIDTLSKQLARER